MLNDEIKLYEENKKLREELKKVKQGFDNLDWEYGTLLDFIEKKGLTEEAAMYMAQNFVKSINNGEIKIKGLKKGNNAANKDDENEDDKVDAVA